MFDKIQHRVASRVDAKSTEAVEAEKHALYKEFLAATNRKVRPTCAIYPPACRPYSRAGSVRGQVGRFASGRAQEVAAARHNTENVTA